MKEEKKKKYKNCDLICEAVFFCSWSMERLTVLETQITLIDNYELHENVGRGYDDSKIAKYSVVYLSTILPTVNGSKIEKKLKKKPVG